MPQLKAWTVRIWLRGPISTVSSSPRSTGIDAPFARNAEDRFYIAGSLVKGRLREALKEMNSATGNTACPLLIQLFGKDTDEGGMDQERGLLYFGDFLAVKEPRAGRAEPKAKIIYRIERDEEMGAVKPKMNQTIESPFASGEEFEFKGSVWTIADRLNEIEKQIRYGLAYISGFGAEVSAGFGRLSRTRVSPLNQIEIPGRWPGVIDSAAIPISLEPGGPLCVGGKRLADNIFESEKVISGAVLKGALAQMLLRLVPGGGRNVEVGAAQGQYGALRRVFSQIRFRHARPVKLEASAPLKRPMATPLSLVWNGRDLRDAAGIKAPRLLKGGTAPAFQPDWKDEAFEAARSLTGQAQVPMELRVRTAISTADGRAKDKSLFAYRVAAPRAKSANGEMEAYQWLSQIDLDAVDEMVRPQVAGDLKSLLQNYGLLGVGKLKTHCKVHHKEWSPVQASTATPLPGGRWIVTLQTPALMLATCQFKEPASEDELRSLLDKYWADVSDQALTLHDYFAGWELAGGTYLQSKQHRKDYQPYLLAQAGSVFVLEATAADAAKGEEKISDWLKEGLPIGPGVRDTFDLKGDASDWEKCSYIPQNGFGEIAVNQLLHSKLALKEEELDAAGA